MAHPVLRATHRHSTPEGFLPADYWLISDVRSAKVRFPAKARIKEILANHGYVRVLIEQVTEHDLFFLTSDTHQELDVENFLDALARECERIDE